MRCGMKLLIYSQSSTVQPLKYVNGYVISSHTFLGMWILLYAVIKVNPCESKGPKRSILLKCVRRVGNSVGDRRGMAYIWKTDSCSEKTSLYKIVYHFVHICYSIEQTRDGKLWIVTKSKCRRYQEISLVIFRNMVCVKHTFEINRNLNKHFTRCSYQSAVADLIRPPCMYRGATRLIYCQGCYTTITSLSMFESSWKPPWLHTYTIYECIYDKYPITD